MSKFYFLPISLILLNPGLADNLDTQRKLVGHAENASVAGAAVGKNPQLLKENLIKIPKITERSTSKNTALKEPSSIEKKSVQLKEVVPNPLQSKKVESQPKGKQPPYFPIEDSSPSIVENTPTEKAPEEVKPKKEPAQPKGKKQIVKQQEVTPEATRSRSQRATEGTRAAQARKTDCQAGRGNASRSPRTTLKPLPTIYSPSRAKELSDDSQSRPMPVPLSYDACWTAPYRSARGWLP